VSKLFRTEGWLTIAQLTGAWSSELAESREDPKQCEQNLVHILVVDIINGRLDASGPLVDGRRLGLRLITPENRAAFVEGSELHDLIRTKQAWLLDCIVVMKEAVLDFAQRHQLPSPSWWTESSSTPMEALTDTKVNVVEPTARPVASRFVGKQPRILKLLSKRFPDGVPEPGLCPRRTLKSDILEWDPSLNPLDEATLKKAIDKYNEDFSK
jgi:hypothetical protein